MFWLWVSNGMYFVSSVQRITKWGDTLTAGRTGSGLFLENLLLKSQPVSHNAGGGVSPDLSSLFSSTHVGLDLEVCLSQVPTAVPPAHFLAPDLEQSATEGTDTVSAKSRSSNLHILMLRAIPCPNLLTCEWAFKTNRPNPCFLSPAQG